MTFTGTRMESKTDILIVGAGLTGLAAAQRLGGRCRVRLVEKAAAPGGLVTTIEERGFRFDRTGHLLHLRDGETKRWIFSFMGGGMLELERRSRIWSSGVYTHYPFQSNTYGLPPAVAAECLMGYLEARERAAAPGGKRRIASFLDFIDVHFGAGFARHFMVPYNRRIWGVHPRRMSAEWCERFVPVPRLEDVIDGAVGRSPEQMGYNARFHYPARGIAELTGRLAALAGRRVEIETGAALVSVDHRRRRALLSTGETVRYAGMISSMPLAALARALAAPPERVRRAAGALRCNPLRYIDVALKAPPAQPWHWVYVPEARHPFYRVGSYSNFSAACAPPGRGSLYVELASRRPVDMRRAMPAVLRSLVEMKMIRREADVLFAVPRLIEYAYVVYDRGRAAAAASLLGFLEGHGIVSTGRYGGWNYSAMEDALVMGRAAAGHFLRGEART